MALVSVLIWLGGCVGMGWCDGMTRYWFGLGDVHYDKALDWVVSTTIQVTDTTYLNHSRSKTNQVLLCNYERDMTMHNTLIPSQKHLYYDLLPLISTIKVAKSHKI